MAKQAKPKVSELVEILIQQMDEFQKVTKERNEVLTNSISKLKYIKVDFNVAELEAMKQANREILKKDFENFHAQTRDSNKELRNIHKKISSNRFLYLTVFNILVFLSAIATIYATVSNFTKQSELEKLVNEKNDLKNQVDHINKFFNDHQKAAADYKDWLEN
ncbi:hypothetical protein [uncultured Christiangramia sp.]|uniref:hypothetical protein n=1 Tax=uncultured Christiangramia sp. TaxID=503836 RepID=UPI002606288A|nr:hypothetical protein [uncultured Christiangramia sp.]